MKVICLFIIAGFALSLSACNKDPNSTKPVSVIGKWDIVSDSTYTGAGIINHPVDYAGQPGDYFDVRTDGNIYTKEGVVLDTLSYHLVSDTGIVIEAFGLTANGVPAISKITTLTAHTLKIVSPVALTPGGVFGRRINLSR